MIETLRQRLSKHQLGRKLLFLLLAVVILLLAVGDAAAQTGGNYDLTWSTIDGGGGNSTGGSYALYGTIGQPDAGVMTGGVYTLSGGFWAGGRLTIPEPGNQIFLPLVMK